MTHSDTYEEFDKLVKADVPYEAEMQRFVSKWFGCVWISKWSAPALFDAYRPYQLLKVRANGEGIKNHWEVWTANALTNEEKIFDWCVTFTRDYIPFHLHPEKRDAVESMAEMLEREADKMRKILELYNG